MKKLIAAAALTLVTLVNSTTVSASQHLWPFQQTDSYRQEHSIVQVSKSYSLPETGETVAYRMAGSGVFIADDLIATSYHCIQKIPNEKFVSISVSFGYAETDMFKNYHAIVVDTDVENDLAILRVTREEAVAQSVPIPVAQPKQQQDMIQDSYSIYGYPNAGGRLFKKFEASFIDFSKLEVPLNEGLDAQEFDVIKFTADIEKGTSGGPIINSSGQIVTVVSFSNTHNGGHDSFGIDPFIFYDFVSPYIEGDE